MSKNRRKARKNSKKITVLILNKLYQKRSHLPYWAKGLQPDSLHKRNAKIFKIKITQNIQESPNIELTTIKQYINTRKF